MEPHSLQQLFYDYHSNRQESYELFVLGLGQSRGVRDPRTELERNFLALFWFPYFEQAVNFSKNKGLAVSFLFWQCELQKNPMNVGN